MEEGEGKHDTRDLGYTLQGSSALSSAAFTSTIFSGAVISIPDKSSGRLKVENCPLFENTV